MIRLNHRAPNQLRPITITRAYIPHAEGSALVEFGQTKVLCTGTVQEGAPKFLKGQQGWLTAEYGLLPRSTHTRTAREAARGKQTGRTMEIQRLISRSLRAAVDLRQLSDYTIIIDCDVIQADGGTRTAAITGGCVALYDVIETLRQTKRIKTQPFIQFIASVSVGICQDEVLLDLDYQEDSQAYTDMNVVLNESGQLIEIQGTAEQKAFSMEQLHEMLHYAKGGIQTLIALQQHQCQAQPSTLIHSAIA